MRKRWLILLVMLGCLSALTGQQNVALLDTPTRLLNTAGIEISEQHVHHFELDRGMIYLQAHLEGQLGQYVLDTGAPGLVINEIPEQQHQGYLAQSCSEEVRVGMRAVNRFVLGSLELRHFEALTLDLEHLSNARQEKVYGLIGHELLRNHTLVIDYQRQQLHVLDYRVNPAIHQPLARIPFEFDGHLPVIEVRVGESRLRLGVDTGSASNILDQSWLSKLDQSAFDVAQREEIQGLDQRIQEVQAVALRNLTFDQCQTDSKFLLLDLSHLRQGSEQPLDGLLGYQFLAQYKVAIDYPNQEILLWPADSEQ